MSFFITSVPKGDGANYGGLAGADAYCQQLGAAAGRGAGVTWHAYLSTQGAGAVNARDRIGNGPWYNARGGLVAMNIAQSPRRHHRAGAHRQPARQTGFAHREEGHHQRRRRHAEPARHPDRLAAGRPRLHRRDGSHLQQLDEQRRRAWARRSSGTTTSRAAATHRGTRRTPSRGCSQANLVATGGAGLLYCFAVN